MNVRISLFDNLVYLPLLHTIVEERAGVRRFPSRIRFMVGGLFMESPSPYPSPRIAGRGDVVPRFQMNLPESEMRPR